MNLQALRTLIKNHTDYSPELQSFNDELDSLINDAYMNIWTTKRWNFAQKEAYLKFYPDILPTRDTLVAGTPVTAAIVQGSRLVNFSAAMDRLVPDVWEDQVIELDGYEYNISKVQSTSSLLLETPCTSADDATNATWKIKHRWYDLPQDCTELLSLAHTDTPQAGAGQPAFGKLAAILPRRAEEINLRRDYASDFAEAYIWSPPQFIMPAEKTAVGNYQTLILNPNDGFPENTYLEVCWAFEKDGKVGALSEPATAFFPDDPGGVVTYTFDISFLSHDDQPIAASTYQSLDGSPSQYEGYRKIVYWNSNYDRTTGERLGLPCWQTFNIGGLPRNAENWLYPVEAADTALVATIGRFEQINNGNARYMEYDGQHLRIRPYPRIDSYDSTVEKFAGTATERAVGQDFVREGLMRYMYKPNYLTKKTDSPELPSEFHQLIVYAALEEIYLKLGQTSMSNVYRRRIEDAIKMLAKRYTDRIDALVQRGQFGSGGGRFSYDATSLRNLS